MQEPADLAEARTYIGRAISKYFPPNSDQGVVGGQYPGTVTGVDVGIEEDLTAIFYKLTYEDEDVEEVTWQTLVSILLPKKEASGRAARRPSPAPRSDAPTARGAQQDDAPPPPDAPAPKRARVKKEPLPAAPPAPAPAPAPADFPQGARGGPASTSGQRADDRGSNGSDGGGAGRPPRGAKRRQPMDADEDASNGEDAAGAGSSGQPSDESEEEQDVRRAGKRAAAGSHPPKAVAKKAAARKGSGSGAQGAAAGLSGAGFGAADEAAAAPAAPHPKGYAPIFSRACGLAGQVHKVTCQNFKCHVNFEITMSKHVTIIGGQNGSGKSAIVEALQVCLGVKTREAGRPATMADSIRNGCDSARVAVTLWNTGTDAWEHATFGNHITIERRLNRSGGHPFKVLDCNGRTHNTSAAYVKTILEHFSVNAGNPLSIVTQPQAKNFFADDKGSSSNKRRYDVFMQASLLADVTESHAATETELFTQKGVLQSMRADLKEVEAKRKALQEQRDKLRDAEELEGEKADVVLAQTLVRRHDARSSAEKEERALEEELPLLRQQQEALLARVEQELRSVEERLKEKTEAIMRQEADMGELVQRTQALAAAVREATRATTKGNNKLGQSQNRLAHLQANKQGLMDKLDIPRPGNERYEEQRQALAAHQQLVMDKQANVAALKTVADDARKAWMDSKEQLMPVGQQHDDATRSLGTQQQRVRQLQQQLQDLQNSGTGRGQQSMARFGGAGVPRLANLVAAQASTFSKLPIGPLGHFLGLKDSQWSTAVENCLGFTLQLWLVNAYEDIRTLQNLARTVGCNNVSVFQCRFDLPQHRVQAPSNGYISVLSVLSCLEPRYEAMIMNCLIDKAHAEDAVLVGSEVAGRAVIYDNAAGARIHKAYDTTGQMYEAKGHTKVLIPYKSNSAPRLGMDQSQQMEQLRNMIHDDEVLVREKGEMVRGVQKELSAAQERVRDTNTTFNATSRQVKVAEQDLQRTMRDTPTVEREGDVDEEMEVINTQIQDTNLEVADVTAEVTADRAAALDLQRREQEARARMDEHTRAQRDCDRRRGDGTLDAEANALLREKADGEAAAQAARTTLVDVEARAVRLRLRAEESRRDEGMYNDILVGVSEAACDAALASVRRRAEGLAPAALERALRSLGQEQLRRVTEEQKAQWKEDWVNGRMVVKELEALEEQLKKQIASSERTTHGVSREDLEHDSQVTEKKYVKKHAQVAQRREIFLACRACLKARQEKFIMTRDNIVATVSAKFVYNLRRRRYDGEIRVNHTSGEIKLCVQLPGTNTAVTDMQAMSGGEQSYVMCAYLMAVGSATESPWRCMDEYDVFMDDMNRFVVTETMLEFAAEESHRQFILLSPQEVSQVRAARLRVEEKRKAALTSAFCQFYFIPAPRANGGVNVAEATDA